MAVVVQVERRLEQGTVETPALRFFSRLQQSSHMFGIALADQNSAIGFLSLFENERRTV
jgi:hypothetical protein